MSSSTFTQGSVVLHAIAVTTALALVSGQLPLHYFIGNQAPSVFQTKVQLGKL